MNRLTSKWAVSALVTVPALLLLLAATRTWLIGRSGDPLLGGGEVTATGSQAAPGVVALAAVALVALVATLTGGPRIRRVASTLMLLAAVGAGSATASALSDRDGTLGRVAASGLGRTGVARTTASATGWAWVSVVAAALLVLASLVGVVVVGRWAGLSSRFDAPREVAATDTRGVRRSDWDEVSEGRDPTVRAGPEAEENPT